MENVTKKCRIRIKRIHIKPQREPAAARVSNVVASSSKRGRPCLTEDHKKAFIDFEKETRVLLVKLKASSHTLWQQVSAKLNAIVPAKGSREPEQWRVSFNNWRNRVMAKKTQKEDLSPIDTAAKKHWKNPV
ncbi:uncharacterized protein [Drosophila kikkawai]|uniref:Uncharacterized protein isoform X2 n=1 Tax=Drosophila kikkawai TaxID=30033 RepID=A0ABM3C6J4_DROKI|nr:uncharacterized protein LOC108079594 isoform X2 [Drosophila kikkawai]